MHYLVIWAWEMDGHAGASAMVCESLRAVNLYISKSLTFTEEIDGAPEEPMGKITSTHKGENGSTVHYGTWDCGDFSITIKPFKTFKEIINKELFTRTG